MRWLWLSSFVVLLDQVTKQVAENHLIFHQPLAVVPSFNLTLMYNEGAAFSFLSQAGGWQRWFFIVLSSVISIVLVIWLHRIQSANTGHGKYLPAGIAFILGGAIGNLVDRVLFGHVIDFIQLYYANFYWPAFNVADSAITVGATLLIIDMIVEHKREQQSAR